MEPFLDPSSIYTLDATPPGYLRFRGVTFFRRWFDDNLTTRGARMQFQACSFYCRVWINGKEIGDHRAGGYGAFVLDAPPPSEHDVQ
jgi:hypothetical protein